MFEVSPIFTYIDNINFNVHYSYPIKLEESGETQTFMSNTTFDNVLSITSIDTVSNKTLTKFPVVEIRIQKLSTTTWSPWTSDFSILEFDGITPNILQYRVQRGGLDQYGILNVSDIYINGTYNLIPINGNQGIITQGSSNIFQPYDIYKVYNISSVQIISVPSYPIPDIIINFRVSQDSQRSWTNWYVLTDDNINRLKPDALRFFNIQYQVINNSDSDFVVSQINLIGEFSNVSNNYLKSNKLGIKSDCANNWTDSSTDTNGICDTTPNPYTSLMNQVSCNPTGFWNPYDKNKSIQLYEFQAQMVQETLGWIVDYYKTDVDRKGRDVVLNEYQLFNINCVCQIKILVPGNKFPDNQIEFGGTDLSDLQLFEIHIMRNEFKNHFGIEERPAVGDIVYICEKNRLYRVEHAGSQKSFMNSTIYYKVQLRKYNQQGNTRSSDNIAANQLKQLTENTTFSELIGQDINDQLHKIGNKPQDKQLSNDIIRKKGSIKAKMVKEKLLSGPNTISEYYYDLSNILPTDFGVIYNPLDIEDNTSGSRTLDMWFRLSSIGYKNNLYTNRVNGIGYSLDIDNNGIYFSINQDVYTFLTPINIDVWYCVVVIFNQLNKNIQFYLLTRKNEDGSGSDPLLNLVKSYEEPLVNTYSWSNLREMGIYGGKINICHIRLWREALDINILYQELVIPRINDSQFIIVSDNVEKSLKTKTFVTIPDPKQLPTNEIETKQKFDILVSGLTNDGNSNISITDQQYLESDTLTRIKYLESKFNIGISNYQFNISGDEEKTYIINNFNFLTDYQFNTLDDSSKIIFLNRLVISNPTGQWYIQGIVPYGLIPDNVFSLMNEIVVDNLITNGWRINPTQWPTLTITQKYNYLQYPPRNILVITPVQGQSESISQFDNRLNINYSKLQIVQTK